MKYKANTSSDPSSGFTLVEVMISMTIAVSVLGMCMSSFLFGLRAMYKDTERLKTNASLRSFMAQVSKETLDASQFYLFRDYTAIDNSVDLESTDSNPAVDTVSMTQIEDVALDDYDKWVGHGDCLVLVTKTSKFRDTDIRQIRIYYRLVTNQAGRNGEAVLRYYETADWGEGTATTANGHPTYELAYELGLINLSANPTPATSSTVKVISTRTKGRKVPSPYTPYAAGDLYPVFSSETPYAESTNGTVSINLEFINGSSVTNLLSSSSFNYTVSPRR